MWYKGVLITKNNKQKQKQKKDRKEQGGQRLYWNGEN